AEQNFTVPQNEMVLGSVIATQSPSPQAEQNFTVPLNEMTPGSVIAGQSPSPQAEQNFVPPQNKMIPGAAIADQLQPSQTDSNAAARRDKKVSDAAADGVVAMVAESVGAETLADDFAVYAPGFIAGQSGNAGSTVSQSPVNPNPATIPADAGQVVANNVENASDEVIAWQGNPVSPPLNQVTAEVVAPVAPITQPTPKIMNRDGDSEKSGRADKARSAAGEGMLQPPLQGVNNPPPVRSQHDALLTQALPQSQLDGQLGADSIREALKGAVDLDKSSTTVDSASRSESLLTSFADSLAAARSVRAEKEVPQLVMPHGLRPGEPAWGQAVNDRVMMMASKNGQFAEIQLDPPELGSLQVRLHLKNDQVSVVFNTPHGSVREALEQNMPRLREMFADQGLNLSDSTVEDHSRRQQRDESGSGSSWTGYQDDVVDDNRVEVVRGESLSLVDYYA
ncbi:flagellar hook-length control protein FliK, partial [Amphritea sp.]|uniref:flagellar hook-length control protein FliK n=1 Tax=Amphritea sp. TaxID=1872502 RepID=UPI003D13360D